MLIFNLRYKQGEESAEAKIFPLSPETQEKDPSLLANPCHTASPLHFPGTLILGSAPEHYPSRLEKEPRMVALGMKHLRKAPGFSLQSLLSSPRLWASRDSQPGLLGLGGTACHSLMTYRHCSCSLRHVIGKECALELCSQQIRLHQLYSFFCFGLRVQSWSNSGTGGGSQEVLVPYFTDIFVTCSQSSESGRSYRMNLLPLSSPTPAMCPAEKGQKTVSYLPIQEAVEYGHHEALGREHKHP